MQGSIESHIRGATSILTEGGVHLGELGQGAVVGVGDAALHGPAVGGVAGLGELDEAAGGIVAEGGEAAPAGGHGGGLDAPGQEGVAGVVGDVQAPGQGVPVACTRNRGGWAAARWRSGPCRAPAVRRL